MKMKRIVALFTVLMALFTLVSCGFGSDMPYNGDIIFNGITVSIPQNFIRDSTQSANDLWVFEKGFYKQLIILSRNDLSGEIAEVLDGYVDYMKSMECDSKRTTFAGCEAVHTTYTKDGQYCQEVLFVYNSSTYAIALRGGTEEEFKSLLDSVKLNALAE